MRINLLVDLSGTLHIGDVACPGAVAALDRIQRAVAVAPHSVRLRFCSNTTKESTIDLQKRLQRAGFSPNLIPSSSILTSLEACKTLAVQHAWRPLLLLTPSAHLSFRRDERLSQQAFFPDPARPPSQMDGQERRLLEQCDTVIVGLAPDLFGAEWMDAAFRVLAGEYSKGEKRLVATHRALYYRPATSEPLSLGPGAYVAALEAASQRSSNDTIVCGKPSTTFFQSCLDSIRAERQNKGEDTGADEERNIIIGDDIEADLGGGAIEMGLERVLVKTGKYRQGDELRTDKAVHVYATFADFVEQHLFATRILASPPVVP